MENNNRNPLLGINPKPLPTMVHEYKYRRRLTKDELWEKAGTREPITREDLGLPPGSQDGLESHPYW